MIKIVIKFALQISFLVVCCFSANAQGQPTKLIDDPICYLPFNTTIWDNYGNQYVSLNVNHKNSCKVLFTSVNDIKVRWIKIPSGNNEFFIKSLPPGTKVAHFDYYKSELNKDSVKRTIPNIINQKSHQAFINKVQFKQSDELTIVKKLAPLFHQSGTNYQSSKYWPLLMVVVPCDTSKKKFEVDGKPIAGGDIIAINPLYEYTYAGAKTNKFRTWKYRYEVWDYGLIALPLTVQWGWGSSVANNITTIGNNYAFGLYYGYRFGKIRYDYGQFGEYFITPCLYFGVSQEQLNGGNTGNKISGSTTVNNLALAPGFGLLYGNTVFSFGLIQTAIRSVGSYADSWVYQNHFQTSLVLGFSLSSGK